MAESIPVTPALYEFWSAVLGEGEFTYDDIRDRGGPSQPTLTKLLKVGESISTASARALEDAVGLERGSLREVAAGGDPRWKPEWNPDGPEVRELNFSNRGQHSTFDSIESGYTAASTWAYDCWKVGVPKAKYYAFIDAVVDIYKTALDARDSGAKRDDAPAPITELSDRRPTVADLKGLPSAAEPLRQDKGDSAGDAKGGNDDGTDT